MFLRGARRILCRFTGQVSGQKKLKNEICMLSNQPRQREDGCQVCGDTSSRLGEAEGKYALENGRKHGAFKMLDIYKGPGLGSFFATEQLRESKGSRKTLMQAGGGKVKALSKTSPFLKLRDVMIGECAQKGQQRRHIVAQFWKSQEGFQHPGNTQRGAC